MLSGIFGLLGGIGMPMQTSVNARLGKKTGSPFTAAFINFLVGTAALLILTVIVERGLHAYANETNAVIRANTFVGTDGGSGVLKCVIPKGTYYWVSEDRSEYCAETLKVDSLSYEVKI